MAGKSLLILAVVTVLAVVGAGYSLQARQDRLGLPSVPESLIPDLLERVNDVAAVEVVTPEERFFIRRGEDGTWRMRERDGYRVLFETVKQAAVGIAALKPLEAKTAKPERHHRIQVVDPRDGETVPGRGTLIRLLDKGGGEVAALVKGKTRSISTADREGWYYVRLAGMPRAWLVSGRIEANEKALRWLDAEMVRVAKPRIRAVTTIQPDGAEVQVARPDTEAEHFTIQNLPEGLKPFHDGVADDLGAALGYVAFDDVRKADGIDFSNSARARFETFDGLVVEVEVAEHDGKKWARFAARFAPDIAKPEGVKGEKLKHLKSPEDAAKEAEAINTRYGAWAYNLPNYKLQEFTKPMSKLAAPKEEKSGG